MKRFDKNFNIEAVLLVIEQGYSASSVEKEFDIHEITVQKYIKEYGIYSDDAFPGDGN
ncbi:transposase [Lutispora thermophila]|uniref:Transposase n=1 Tax=Lutispora thermophila DSM 19022 TaxID=1122184 RepID=A0A1M6DT43_9FIRM|nr:transposase [Lutispora thermophila]SHI76382.1 transposase [Lutispora thermophila DSM 19022]